MPKPRYIRHLIYPVLLLPCLLSANLWSQSTDDLARLYRDNKIVELEGLRQKNQIVSPDWKIFVDALFEPDAEIATQKMLEAYTLTRERDLKNYIRQRISQFYSSRGYYETSRRVLNDDHFFEGIVSLKSSRSQESGNLVKKDNVAKVVENGQTFGVQVGAYSTYENASQASQKYKNSYSNTKVLEKDKDGISLYIVVVGGYPSREEAASAMDAIHQKYKVKGYIIQY